MKRSVFLQIPFSLADGNGSNRYIRAWSRSWCRSSFTESSPDPEHPVSTKAKPKIKTKTCLKENVVSISVDSVV